MTIMWITALIATAPTMCGRIHFSVMTVIVIAATARMIESA
jgi:hypothetical protein